MAKKKNPVAFLNKGERSFAVAGLFALLIAGLLYGFMTLFPELRQSLGAPLLVLLNLLGAGIAAVITFGALESTAEVNAAPPDKGAATASGNSLKIRLTGAGAIFVLVFVLGFVLPQLDISSKGHLIWTCPRI